MRGRLQTRSYQSSMIWPKRLLGSPPLTDPIAIWGALTGSVGAGVALGREMVSRRKRLAVRPGVNYNISRRDPIGAVTHAWAFVQFWNTGGRPIAVERAGFKYYVSTDLGDGVMGLKETWAEIAISKPIELPVDGPSAKVHTPLGPMLAAGIDPVSDVYAYAITAGDREWEGSPQPLVQSLLPPMTPELLLDGLEALTLEAELPPKIGHLISLRQEGPYLPPDDFNDGASSGPPA